MKSLVIISVISLCGLIEGGIKVIIEGRNLGMSKVDIVDLIICECECVDFVVWEFFNRIYCTIKLFLVGIGNVEIKTEFGNIGRLR